jgi:AcrR family transcriptional regulator
VDLNEPPVSARRRRGQELEDAILGAAWDALIEAGYAAFTIDAVAERARTSRPVLYRRWKTREDLALAAIAHHVTRDVRPIPDTGTLRDDVIAVLLDANETRIAMAAIIVGQLGSYYQETRTSPADLRREVLGDRTTAIDIVMRRAVERGEIDPARVTPRIANLPFDLCRHEVMMTLAPVPRETIVEIVDDIFLPLVT